MLTESSFNRTHSMIMGFIIVVFILVFATIGFNIYFVLSGKDICQSPLMKFATIEQIPAQCLFEGIKSTVQEINK